MVDVHQHHPAAGTLNVYINIDNQQNCQCKNESNVIRDSKLSSVWFSSETLDGCQYVINPLDIHWLVFLSSQPNYNFSYYHTCIHTCIYIFVLDYVRLQDFQW